MKTIFLLLFLCGISSGYATDHQIDENHLISHHGFIREIVTDLVERTMDDDAPVTMTMKDYRELVRNEQEGFKDFFNACQLSNLARDYDALLDALGKESKQKDFVIAKSIDDLVRLEKKIHILGVELFKKNLELKSKFPQQQKSESEKKINEVQLQVALYDTEDKILLLKQDRERYFYALYNHIRETVNVFPIQSRL
jgi:hypothetical protein